MTTDDEAARKAALIAKGRGIAKRLSTEQQQRPAEPNNNGQRFHDDWQPPDEPPDDAEPTSDEPPAAAVDTEPIEFGAVDGGTFIFDEPADIPAVWGHDKQVLWSDGEALMIAGTQGLGKTTLAGLLVRGLCGLGDGRVLGMPVAECPGKILYLAMDRPRQIARSMRRQFAADERDTIAQRLLVRRGPPPADLAAHPTVLAAIAEHHDAAVVFIDSLKDAALGLSNDEVGAAWNRARQHVLAAGRELCELHHPVKRGPNGAPVKDINDVYGSAWLTNGCGSVILLTGEPGDPLIGFRHVKQPGEELGPWTLLHDQTNGELTVEHSVDLVALVGAGALYGLTANSAVCALFGTDKPRRAQTEKARRKLDDLVGKSVLVRVDGVKGGAPSTWFLAENTITE